jgi:uncharacterized protein (TIGR02722 family)
VVLPPREELAYSMEALIHHFKLVSEGFMVPAGEAYAPIESPRGEMGCYVVSDGGPKPHRVHMRDPSFVNLQATAPLCKGTYLADLIAIVATLPLALVGCQKAQYVDPKGNDLVVNADRMNIQDWNLLADQVVQSMVNSGVLARLPNQPAGVLLNPVINTTTQQFDTDGIMKKIRISLLNTGRCEVIMTAGPGGRAEDKIAQDAQALKDFQSGKDNQVNPNNVPDATLTAKLIEDRARSGSTRQVAYVLQMSLTNTTTGRAVWEGEASVIKQGQRSSVGF